MQDDSTFILTLIYQKGKNDEIGHKQCTRNEQTNSAKVHTHAEIVTLLTWKNMHDLQNLRQGNFTLMSSYVTLITKV